MPDRLIKNQMLTHQTLKTLLITFSLFLFTTGWWWKVYVILTFRNICLSAEPAQMCWINLFLFTHDHHKIYFYCRSAMSMAERKIENKQIIISYSASLLTATKFPNGQFNEKITRIWILSRKSTNVWSLYGIRTA